MHITICVHLYKFNLSGAADPRLSGPQLYGFAIFRTTNRDQYIYKYIKFMHD